MEIEINYDLISFMLLYSFPHDFDNFRIAIESRDLFPSPQVLKVNTLEEDKIGRSEDKKEQ